MIVVAHRRNTLEQLAATPTDQGVEMDVRVHGERLVVAHSPFEDGVDLDDWLAAYAHALLVVNVKEEGLVAHVLPLLKAHHIERFFFLGAPLGEVLEHSKTGERRFAVRVSEVHHPNTALAMAGRVDWVWLDGFEGFPVSAEVLASLHQRGLAICLVSPELYGRADALMQAYWAEAFASGVPMAAVCTRQTDAWSLLTPS